MYLPLANSDRERGERDKHKGSRNMVPSRSDYIYKPCQEPLLGSRKTKHQHLCTSPFCVRFSFPSLFFLSLPLSLCVRVCVITVCSITAKKTTNASAYFSLCCLLLLFFYFFATAKTHTHTVSSPLLFSSFSRRSGRKLFAAMEVTLLSIKMFSRVENTEGKKVHPLPGRRIVSSKTTFSPSTHFTILLMLIIPAASYPV